MPSDVEWIYSLVAEIAGLIQSLGADEAPIHGDANCSNVALNRKDNSALLLDFDWASKADPLQDVGSALLEFGLTEYQGREVFELFWGSFEEGLYCRARLYAAAEAVRGALLGVWLDRVDPGMQEYSKFADWMFLRARVALSAYVTDDHLRRVK
ncbi:phosphotransferase family protein [Nesterenkonia sp. NBAIMH1]|uniref:phosphotransferase family protein n=1 Tax=Nesterenkonia sp. NBAIMH1 TaxID=2600320 RepID=UPI0011B53F90|nr:phosphotransferase [Nesterenkonia sp. NBAIMH1]